MADFGKDENIREISRMYSFFGRSILEGNVSFLKQLYGALWKEEPVVIKVMNQLQNLLTWTEIENDSQRIFSNDFLYYWGMTCIGEQSNLILKDLPTAEICFRKIIDEVPKAEARLAYIELLKSDDPARNELNVKRIDTLRRWAGMQDLFSNIVLAKIVFYQSLCESQAENTEEIESLELPVRMLALLDSPCQKGHPVAIRFYNTVMESIGTQKTVGMKIDECFIDRYSLYDI